MWKPVVPVHLSVRGDVDVFMGECDVHHTTCETMEQDEVQVHRVAMLPPLNAQAKWCIWMSLDAGDVGGRVHALRVLIRPSIQAADSR
jgi:hypothetical protein